MAPTQLSNDIFHLVMVELRSREDLSSLFNCAASCSRLAGLALPNLYRVSRQSPGSDEEAEGGQAHAQQRAVVMKWCTLWRSLLLSTLKRTLFPYHRYIKSVDLRDLENLLDEVSVVGEKALFATPLAKFHHRVRFLARDKIAWRLDVPKILEDVADALTTPSAPLIEEVTGRFTSDALLQWLPRLPRLERLELGKGLALANRRVHEAIYTHCPKFAALTINEWISPSSDEELGAFLVGLPQHSLTFLRTIRACGINTQTCLALGNHGGSLTRLYLEFSPDAVSAMASLRSCKSIEDLQLEIPGSIDLVRLHNDTFTELVAWLCECKNLRKIALENFSSGPAILMPLLANSETRLEEVALGYRGEGYLISESDKFHGALGSHESLCSLSLKGDHEWSTFTDMDVMITAICKLRRLKRLELRGVADIAAGDGYMSNEAFIRIFQSLTRLEDVYLTGFEITDAVLVPLAELRNLRRITFSAVSSFTAEGLIKFVAELGPDNKGLVLAVDAAEPLSLMTDAQVNVIRDKLYEQVEGRFDYIPLRDPHMPDDYDDSGSD